MNNLFEKYPVINYQNNPAVNILSKIQFDKTNLINSQLFHPYTLKEGERADVLAYDYYGDSRYAWIIYLTNKIVDPYYNWPLSDEEFKKFIVKKYGSIENAVKLTAFYRIQYESDDRMLTTSAYKDLPSSIKKYWNPIFGETGLISGYERKRSDEARETNKTIFLDVDNPVVFAINDIVTTTDEISQLTLDTNTNPQVDDTVQQGTAVGTIVFNMTPDSSPKTILVKTINGTFTSNSTPIQANSFSNCAVIRSTNTVFVSEGTVKNITNNTLIVQHVSGRFASKYGFLNFEDSLGYGKLNTEIDDNLFTEASRLIKKGTTNFANVTNVVNEVLDSSGNPINVLISDLEYVYWEPVSYFTYETELNDSKKFIYLLDKRYLDKTEKQISDLLL